MAASNTARQYDGKPKRCSLSSLQRKEVIMSMCGLQTASVRFCAARAASDDPLLPAADRASAIVRIEVVGLRVAFSASRISAVSRRGSTAGGCWCTWHALQHVSSVVPQPP